jgi:hypothetical protein
MKSYIIGGFNAGLGSTYDTLYRFVVLQSFLKNLGYEVFCEVDFSLNPYKMNNQDRSIFKKIFKFDLLDNILFHVGDGFNMHDTANFELNKKTKLVFNNNKILYVYVDSPITELKNIEQFINWQNRDDLPKICCLVDELIYKFEEKLTDISNTEFYSIHYRPFELENQKKQMDIHLPQIIDILEKNRDKKILLTTQYEILKKKLSLSNYDNLQMSNYQYPTDFNKVRSLGWTDEQLLDYMQETFFEMYCLSKSTKIYRVGCPWFSNFLFLSCTYNQTNFENKLRFEPSY